MTLKQRQTRRDYVRWSGSGVPLLLLHGFPQTHLMWRSVAPLLARNFTVVCADLRGYGRSGCPTSTPDHAPYAKRVMAQDMVIVMERLGFPRFSVAGHDRGGRVAYRLALDHPSRVDRVAVLDILPTRTVWEKATRSMPAISSRKRLPNTRPKLWRASSPLTRGRGQPNNGHTAAGLDAEDAPAPRYRTRPARGLCIREAAVFWNGSS